MTAFTRRSAIAGAAAATIATAVSATCATASPMFLAFERAYREFTQACCDDMPDQVCQERLGIAYNALENLIATINAKPVTCEQDVRELASALHLDSYGGRAICHLEYIGESRLGTQHALLRAVLKMGVHHG